MSVLQKSERDKKNNQISLGLIGTILVGVLATVIVNIAMTYIGKATQLGTRAKRSIDAMCAVDYMYKKPIV